MTLDGQLRQTNRNMIAFDLVLGLGRAARARRRPCGCSATTSPPTTPRSSSAAAARSGSPSPPPTWSPTAANRAKDWWALAWLRGTELATDILWSRSPAFSRPGARAGLWFAGLGNLAMTLGFGYLARRGD